MEQNAIKEIMKFQKDRNLHENKFENTNEHANIVEELLESVGLIVEKEKREELKQAFKDFIQLTQLSEISYGNMKRVTEEEKVDAYADVIVFAIGALMKLGYNPEKVLAEVGKEINSREGIIVDGKFQKDMSDDAQSKWYQASFEECKL